MINVGHRNEQVTAAIRAQLEKYIHTCSLVTTMEPYLDLAELLNSLTPGDFAKKTLLANSGSEAVENAVNIAKYYTNGMPSFALKGPIMAEPCSPSVLPVSIVFLKKASAPTCPTFIAYPLLICTARQKDCRMTNTFSPVSGNWNMLLSPR